MISTNCSWGTDTDHGSKVGRLAFIFLLNVLGKTTSQVYKQFLVYLSNNLQYSLKE